VSDIVVFGGFAGVPPLVCISGKARQCSRVIGRSGAWKKFGTTYSLAKYV
jgi:hypothetical protein